MSAFRFGRTQKVLTLVPIAAASVLWTASLVGVGAGTASAGQENSISGVLPDGTTVPTEAIEAPASVTRGLYGDTGGIVSTASANDIPAPALAAYQRAETIINAADTSCHLPWQLVAAIGRVESDHGRFGGNVLDNEGVARPGIYGIALDGTHNTRRITDTDAGQYDDDQVFDRAVGPMQFIPSTWQVVGVDADDDGERNPQDIDDAALATAVYLCSGDDDLSTVAGQQAAVFRYNHSQRYVDLVLSIMHAYLDGNFTTVPAGTTSAGWFVPDPAYVASSAHGPKGSKGSTGPHAPGGTSASAGGATSGGTGDSTSTFGGDGGGDGGSTLPGTDGGGTVEVPTEETSPLPDPITVLEDPTQVLQDPPKVLEEPVATVEGTTTTTLTQAEATTKCLAQVGAQSVLTLGLKTADFQDCMANLGF